MRSLLMPGKKDMSKEISNKNLVLENGQGPLLCFVVLPYFIFFNVFSPEAKMVRRRM